MQNRTIHVYDGSVITDAEGNLVADDTRLNRLVARREYEHTVRSKSAELIRHETAQNEQREQRRTETERDVAGQQTGSGTTCRHSGTPHPFWSRDKRDMRRLATEFRFGSRRPCTSELLASLDDTVDDKLCEGCIRLPDYCICRTERHILSGQADDIVLAEYAAYQAYCRETIFTGCTPVSFRDYVARGLGRPDEYEPDWDYLEDYPETRHVLFASSGAFGTTFERYDASDYGRELNSRFADEY